MRPIVLQPNVFPHFYRGGSRLSGLRGAGAESGPEDWLAATVHRAGDPAHGPSRLDDGTLFAELVAADPSGWLGEQGSGPAGPADIGILVKLLDAGQRLPVHVHPDRRFAGTSLKSCYGKTEAWYVLAVDGDAPSVWLGFVDDVDPAEVARATRDQDPEWLLARMNRIPVVPGVGIVVPAGVVHAIGEGVFVAEVQEPTDLSILLEWSITTSGPDEAFLGLGCDRALTAVDCRRLGPRQLAALTTHTDPAARSDTPMRLLAPASDAFFAMNLLAPVRQGTVTAAPGFAVVVVLEGAGTLRGAGGDVAVRRGQALAVPAAFGPWSVTGDVSMIQCLPGARADR